jgi:hypothetical protein
MNIAGLCAFELSATAVIQLEYGNFYARLKDTHIIYRNTIIS